MRQFFVWSIRQMSYFWIAPTPGFWSSPLDVIGFLFDSVPMAFFILWILQCVRKNKRHSKSLAGLYIVMVYTVIYALGTVNAGTAMRHRDQLLGIMVMAVLVYIGEGVIMQNSSFKGKIVFFLGSMRRGGAERVISILSREYAGKGWETHIGALLFYELGYELDSSTRFLDFTGGGGFRMWRVPYWLRTIRRYAKREKPDVIVSFAARINALVQLACIGLNIPIVVSERSDPWHDGREMPVRMLNGVLYPRAKKVVFQTRRIESYFGRRIRNNGCIILNPIAVTTKAYETRKKKIVTAGRLAKEKNHRLLLESFCDVAALYPQYELWIYGEGDLREELMDLCKTLSIEDKVYFPGNFPNVHREMADAEMFVLSSDYEGLSNALMEAMMMGLPCISTRCSGADELISDGENGLLVPIGDKEKLTAAMKRLIDDKELARRIGRNAERDSKCFTVETVLEKWDKVIIGE